MEKKLISRKSCFWGHSYGKWALYEQKYTNMKYGGIFFELRQRRVCEVCGKTQDIDV